MCIRDSIKLSLVSGESLFLFGVFTFPPTLKIRSLSTDEGEADKYLLASTDNNGNLGPFSCHHMKGFSSVDSISMFSLNLISSFTDCKFELSLLLDDCFFSFFEEVLWCDSFEGECD